MPALSQNQRGLIAVVVAMALFVSNDAAMKMASHYLPVGENIFFRGLFAAGLCLAVILSRGEMHSLRLAASWLVLVRGVLEIVGSFMFQIALLLMPIGDATAIVQMAPLLLLAFAAFALREKVSAGRLIAVATGFAGAVIVAAPTGAVSLGAAMAFGTALVVACRDLLARHIGHSISPLVVTFVTNLIVAASALVIPFGDNWAPPPAPALLLLVAAGVCIGAGYVAMTYAMIWGKVQQLAPLYYSQTIFAVFYSIVLFRDSIALPALTGMAMILAAGLYAARPDRSVRASGLP